jgi:antitoxin YefM
MQRMNLAKDIKPISEFRANATTLLDQVGRTKRPLIITQHGKSAAVLLGVLEYEALLEKIELLIDIANAEEDIKNGRTVLQEKVKSLILKK